MASQSHHHIPAHQSVFRILKILHIHDIEAIGRFDFEKVIDLCAFLTTEFSILTINDLIFRIISNLRNVTLVLKLNQFCRFPNPVSDSVAKDIGTVILHELQGTDLFSFGIFQQVAIAIKTLGNVVFRDELECTGRNNDNFHLHKPTHHYVPSICR